MGSSSLPVRSLLVSGQRTRTAGHPALFIYFLPLPIELVGEAQLNHRKQEGEAALESVSRQASAGSVPKLTVTQSVSLELICHF